MRHRERGHRVYDTVLKVFARHWFLMRALPKAVIHINFEVSDLLLDVRPVRVALEDAAHRGAISALTARDLIDGLAETGLSLATRHYLMRTAVAELIGSLRDIYSLIQDEFVPAAERMVRGPAWYQTRDRVLVAVDSFLFEFRSFLELLAGFAYRVLVAVGKGPPERATLSTGKQLTILTKKRKRALLQHNFICYLCDSLGVSVTWYEFLAIYRNFFAHEGAPYCAIEDRLMFPAEYDLLIMRKNIKDFGTAHPDDFFRISECKAVVDGLQKLSTAVQDHLVRQVQQA